ncbi:MAG: DUF354 domain-containing protein [Bacteroidetes bacterium]|uniref:DUF354 domain-containing protein n=1 Tax=Candidatus Enterocola intestinipullorum TaxID=2840783 RepID=A0A9D9EGW1_9BACT|nr:DUF354 domain-containing protein [Candidatus Enterocola intestinipullorum]
MKVWIDILHTPQFNFYKNLIAALSSRGSEVLVTVLGRGKLPLIAKEELAGMKNVTVETIGRHRMTKFSAIIEANLLRFFQLFIWGMLHKFDIAFSNGRQCCEIARLKRKPYSSFEDDPQSLDSKLKTVFGTKEYLCVYQLKDGETRRNNMSVLPVLKEWAYLNEKLFRPDSSVLSDYGLKPYAYLFFREVSVGTINYAGQAPDSILQMANAVPVDMPVLLSLEKKTNRSLYPKHWILLQEPVKDIHSLIYYSCGLVSSGDSMAREAALLGIPAYYLGIRYDMPANLAAAEIAYFSNRRTISIDQWLKKVIMEKQEVAKHQAEIRASLSTKFIDINSFMLDIVEQNRRISKA